MRWEKMLIGVACGVLSACEPPLPAVAPVAGQQAPATPAPAAAPVLPPISPSALVVSEADPSWGNVDAPVTLVWFGSFECPFTRKSVAVIDGLQQAYGPEKLRVVWKSHPETTADQQVSAWKKAETANVVLQRKGTDAFWTYLHAAFAAEPFPGASDAGALAAAGLRPEDVEPALASGSPKRKVEADGRLAKEVNVHGTPAFFVNGVLLGGLRGSELFRDAIDRQLALAAQLRTLGVPATEISARLTTFGLGLVRTARGTSVSAAEAVRTALPLGTSPARGPKTAPVTVVAFGNFDDVGWRRTMERLEQLRKERGDQVRIVWKHLAWDSSPAAEPAAQLLFEARAQKGDDAFWKAFDLLVAGSGRAAADFELIATQVGLSAKATTAAMKAHKHRSLNDADLDLADTFSVFETTFYVNGRGYSSPTFDKLREIIDDELAHPPQVGAGDGGEPYASILRTAPPPRPLPEVTLPRPEASVPSTGPADAALTITVFGYLDDMNTRVLWHRLRGKILPELNAKIRIVYYPPSKEKDKDLLQRMALFVLRQKGNEAFFKITDSFSRVPPDAADDGLLKEYAKAAGVDVAAMKAAPALAASDPLIVAADSAAAAANVTAAPSVVIGKTLLRGLAGEARLRRIIRSALAAKP
jgi:protein-disulfide isomerase